MKRPTPTTAAPRQKCNKGFNPLAGVRIGEAGNPGPKAGRNSNPLGPRERGGRGIHLVHEGSPPSQTAVEQVKEEGEFLHHAGGGQHGERRGEVPQGSKESRAQVNSGHREDIFWAPLGSGFEEAPQQKGEYTGGVNT